MEEATLEFSDEALQAIACKAMTRDVGARALRSVVEEMMLDLMFELPDAKDKGTIYEISAEMITGDEKPTLFSAVKKKSA